MNVFYKMIVNFFVLFEKTIISVEYNTKSAPKTLFLSKNNTFSMKNVSIKTQITRKINNLIEAFRSSHSLGTFLGLRVLMKHVNL